VLDAGCGSCTKAIHLARRGYSVLGVDLSDKVLEVGRREAAEAGLGDRISLQCEDLTSMTLADGCFGRVLCWGVLMHIPEADRAIAELARVAQPNGLIVVSEGNMRSVQAVAMRLLKRLPHRERGELRYTAAGVEAWEKTPTGELMTRQARRRDRAQLRRPRREAGEPASRAVLGAFHGVAVEARAERGPRAQRALVPLARARGAGLRQPAGVPKGSLRGPVGGL
jgi:SAM-dependent methyltransferase